MSPWFLYSNMQIKAHALSSGLSFFSGSFSDRVVVDVDVVMFQLSTLVIYLTNLLIKYLRNLSLVVYPKDHNLQCTIELTEREEE